MPRKPLLLQSVFPYHVTARSNNREWFYVPTPIIWEICCRLFSTVNERYGSVVIEFVLMSNHFHLLISTPGANLDRIMNYFMREFSRTVGSKTGRINHVFGGRYKGSLIRDALHFSHVYKYILRNPVAGGLAVRVEDYPFSTVRREWGEEICFPISSILAQPLAAYIPIELSPRLEWLNKPYSRDQSGLLRRALKQTEFRFPTHHRHRSIVEELGQR